MTIVASPELRFEVEWERAVGVQSSELAATWARLEVWVSGQCVTQVEDLDNGSARRSIYLSLYPLAEWVAFNWWSLQANVRPSVLPNAALGSPRSASSQRWFAAHNLRAAADGFVWPNVAILPEGPATRVSWFADEQPRLGAPIRFLSGGEARLDPFSVERSLGELVESVLTRLDEQGVGDVPLREEWEAVTSADDEERDFCLAAARLGLDPYNLRPDLEQSLLHAGELLDGRLLRDFLEAVTPDEIGAGLNWLARSAKALDAATGTPSDVVRAVQDINPSEGLPGAFGEPWTKGWHEAKMVRDALGLSPHELFNTAGTFNFVQRDSADPHLEGLGKLSEGAGTLVIGEKLRPVDGRFAQARSLWHALAPPSNDRFLLTSSAAYGPRVERAFAAEVLAPAAGIKTQLPAGDGGVVTSRQVRQVASHFKVNPFIVRHQIENQLALAVTP